MLPVQKILCPIDFSPPSYKALQIAIELASHFEAELILLHVVSFSAPGIPADPAYAFEGLQEYEKAEKQIAEKQLASAVQQVPPQLKSRTAIATGEAADEIAGFAKAEAVDLMVIASHGVTGWRHLVFGSVAEKIVRLADRAVLVIPAHDLQQAK